MSAEPLRNRRRQRGFTLVELMVAVTGGLFMAVVVFALARDGARFYQRESRVATATLSAMIGFNRLSSDIGRAAFLSSPNIRSDPFYCGNALSASVPAGISNLAGLQVTQNGSPAVPVLQNNGRNPDSLLLAGSYTSSDQFPVWNVENTGAGFVVYLQSQVGPLARLGFNLVGADKQAILESVFGATAGRILRIVDRSGSIQYGSINSVSASPQPQIELSTTPSLRFRFGNQCGLTGNVTGATVNVVNLIRYDVRNLNTNSAYGGANANYAAIYASTNLAPHDSERTELTRVELDSALSPIAGTEELVAEYAVDLKFGLTYVPSVLNGTAQSLTTLPPDNANIPGVAGELSSNPGALPQRVRALRARLSVRSREADRERDVIVGGSVAPGFYRMALATNVYARVRTLQAEISLPNQAGVTW